MISRWMETDERDVNFDFVCSFEEYGVNADLPC